ncbi:MAG: lipoyl synthase [Acidobacteriota bacterium]
MSGGAATVPKGGKPAWLRVRLTTGEGYGEVRRMMRTLRLNTVCEEARCPNIYECWSERTATFMILGDVCTRRCGFCAVATGRPRPVDPGEPERVAAAVVRLGLDHAVITSVDRDDLPDGGAGQFAAVVRAVRRRAPRCEVEVLTPDFRGVADPLDIVLPAGPTVFSHNIETVPSLYAAARIGSRFERSVDLLREAVRWRAGRRRPLVKTGLMLGLGEARGELMETLRLLAGAGVEILTLGQYLQPTRDHLPVVRYYRPEEFAELGRAARALGFRHVEAGPLVRSSYRAKSHARRALEDARVEADA